MKNLQKSAKKPAKTPFSYKKATKNSRQAQSADLSIDDFSQVNYVTVTDNQDGQRVDNFLLSRLKGLPRSHLYKMIRADEIRVNGKRCKAQDRLSTSDVVRIAPIRLGVKQAVVVSEQLAKGLLARVIYENEGLIVFNKPYGMAVHGGSGESFGVIEAMREAMGKKYLELVHRIDKDTSGLLLIAKKRSRLKSLQEQFRQKTIHKQYLCLVDGHPKVDSQTINAPLLKYTLPNGERRVKVTSTTQAGAKDSLTKIKVLARFYLNDRPVSLVLAMPATGRTHQIRVHMAHIGHALLGDEKYQRNPAAAQVKRLCLHAWQLNMTDGDKADHFIVPLADDMVDYLPSGVQDILGKGV